MKFQDGLNKLSLGDFFPRFLSINLSTSTCEEDWIDAGRKLAEDFFKNYDCLTGSQRRVFFLYLEKKLEVENSVEYIMIDQGFLQTLALKLLESMCHPLWHPDANYNLQEKRIRKQLTIWFEVHAKTPKIFDAPFDGVFLEEKYSLVEGIIKDCFPDFGSYYWENDFGWDSDSYKQNLYFYLASLCRYVVQKWSDVYAKNLEKFIKALSIFHDELDPDEDYKYVSTAILTGFVENLYFKVYEGKKTGSGGYIQMTQLYKILDDKSINYIENYMRVFYQNDSKIWEDKI